MALRNAFSNISTENGLRRIANLLTFARDSGDRIRVVVDSGSITISGAAVVYNRNTNSTMQGVSESLFSQSSWNLMDAREQQRIQMNSVSANIKKNRWTF